MRIAAAAFLYFLVVFGAGFVLGPIRVLWLEPRVGPLFAVLCESPFMLTAIVLAARFVPQTMHLRIAIGPMCLVGFGALCFLQFAEYAVGLWLRNMSLTDQLLKFATPDGMVYAVLLVVFAVMPLLANRPAAN